MKTEGMVMDCVSHPKGGWSATVHFEREVPVGTRLAPQPAQQAVADAAGKWRKLALQFDAHRMQALWHLKAMTKDPQAHVSKAVEFLSAPPPQPAQPELFGDYAVHLGTRTNAPQPAQQPGEEPVVEAIKKLHTLLRLVPADGVTALDVCRVVSDWAAEIIHILERAAPQPAQQAVGPVAWMRYWAFKGEIPKKTKNKNGKLAWETRHKLLPVTQHRCLPDDVALIAAEPQPAQQPVPKDCDVRKILLAVVPGPDGMGREVYAKNISDVVDKLTEMDERLEAFETAAPQPAQQAGGDA